MWHSLFIKGPSLPGFLELTGDITGIGIASIPDISVELCAKLCTNKTFECCSIKYSPTKKDCHHFKECVPNVNNPFEDYILYQKGIWVNFFYLGKCKEKIHYYCFYLQSHASKMDNTPIIIWKRLKKFPLLMIVKKNVRNIHIVNFGPTYLMYLITTITLAIVTFIMMSIWI